MTTIDIAGFPGTAAGHATRLRLTARGRRVLAVLAALPAAVALSVAVISGGGAIASSTPGAPADSFASVTVMPGDTLWSIAEQVAPAADPRDVIDEIMRLNALPGAGLDAGQSIAIPARYTAGG